LAGTSAICIRRVRRAPQAIRREFRGAPQACDEWGARRLAEATTAGAARARAGRARHRKPIVLGRSLDPAHAHGSRLSQNSPAPPGTGTGRHPRARPGRAAAPLRGGTGGAGRGRRRCRRGGPRHCRRYSRGAWAGSRSPPGLSSAFYMGCPTTGCSFTDCAVNASPIQTNWPDDGRRP
jgi:hypothetical protein